MDLKTCHQDNVTCIAEGTNIKNEYLDRSPSRCERTVPNNPPTISATNGLFSGISAAKRLRIDGDWLATTHQNVGCKVPPHTPSHSSGSSAGPSCSSSNASVYQANGYPTAVITPNNYAQYDSKKSVREEMISQSAYSLNMSADQNKKKTHSRQQEELCLVCGDRASGYHYNALTCEGCKGFFRRSITKNAVYQCKYGNECEIDMYMRRKCQECRLKKCLRVGMRPECVVPSGECEKKKQTKEEAMRKKNEWNGTTDASKGDVKSEDSSPGSAAFTKTVSPEHEELIHSLVYFQEQYEQPAPEDLERVLKDVREAHEVGDMKFRQITEMTILTVQLIVEFAKSLPGFDKLQREDQITLLKACSSEVMMLRMARKYDSNTDSIVFANNEPYTKDSYNMAGMGETIEDLLRFCRQMCAMKVDNAEYALLTAIVIFSTRPCLLESWKVEKIQEIYIETLKAYVETRIRPNSLTIFARLLSVLTELRTLGNRNSEMCFALKLKSKALPPFLSEIWDIAP